MLRYGMSTFYVYAWLGDASETEKLVYGSDLEA